MNENIDLTKILKDCPIGWEFYSSIYGYVIFHKIENSSEYPIKFFYINKNNSKNYGSVTKQGLHVFYFNGECTLFPSKEQRDWSKFTAIWYKNDRFDQKMVKPKFKVGDRVRHKETNKDDVYEISKVYDDSYGIVGFTWMIYMKYQDQYELIPNKFDPKTLKPFDKVLVRDKSCYNWMCELFSHIKIESEFKYWCISNGYKYCIPYNNDTKHLAGTKEEAPEHYKYWED